ncbi:3-deoxy-8-phosphooctulonate synthase [Candidatus Pseudothioglobus sp. Uisw_050_01]|uniref:3-deoxy-8-phosphooctulonate synthase n=1 Tax=Candidatus Pseudothioglobus sp. Uisw_050_01 TaxID=3230997 RepID=UPI003A881B9C
MNLLDFQAGIDHPFFLIAGPCVVESESLAMESASYLKKVCSELNINFIYKSSYDKANRTSADSFRGLGIEEGLRILEKVKSEVEVSVLTDVHEDSPLDEVSSVVDVLQTPAFLVRQTNFIQNVCSQGLPVNIKKGQFQAPWDMVNVVEKAKATGNQQIMVCDRGTSFGYNTLVSDMRGLSSMRSTNCPIVFDATHSVQQPGGEGASSGGQREMVPVLARAAVAVGVSGVFMETHPNPKLAKSDGLNSMPMNLMFTLLETLKKIDEVTKNNDLLEDSIND